MTKIAKQTALAFAVGIVQVMTTTASAENRMWFSPYKPFYVYKGGWDGINDKWTLNVTCENPKSRYYVYRKGAANTSHLNGSAWCQVQQLLHLESHQYGPGQYEVRLFGGEDFNTGVVARLPFEIRDVANLVGCRNFTTTIRYTMVTLQDLKTAGISIPQELIQFLSTRVSVPNAYAQVKGNWCFGGGVSLNQVRSYNIRPIETSMTGSGLAGLTGAIRPISTGAVYVENYGNGATRYRIAQSKATISLTNPVEVELTVLGSKIKIPPGTRDIHTLRADTLLTGEGNASCAGTANGPCTVELGPIAR
jgi:hypothetical protein